MIGVSNSAPRLPVLVRVNVPPPSSSGLILLLRVRSARSAILRASPARFKSPASWMTGTVSPRLGVHSDAEVLGPVIGDRLLFQIDRGIQHRMDLERLDQGGGEERQERELDAFPPLEVGLGPLAKPGNRRDVDLDDGGQLRRYLQGLHHAGRDELPAPTHFLHATASVRGGDAARLGRGRCVDASGLGPGRLCGLATFGCLRVPGGLGGPLGGGKYVGLADSTAHAGAGHGGQVDAVLAR